MFQQRLKEQTERHDGGSYWIGTGGSSHFGNSGHLSRGIRVGGDTRNLTALQIAGNREYKDFRDDEVLDIRQFQMAFRRLRQFSTQEDGAKDELQLEESIQKTCDNAGYLQLVFDRPRRNSVKVMLLFDSGGSMWRFTKLCSTLFQAATKANRFKDLKIYYFHNCFHDNLYNSPRLGSEYAIKTEWVMHNLRDYKVIVIGDAAMDPDDLESPQAYAVGDAIYEATGIDWLRYFHSRYKKMVWPESDSEKQLECRARRRKHQHHTQPHSHVSTDRQGAGGGHEIPSFRPQKGKTGTRVYTVLIKE